MDMTPVANEFDQFDGGNQFDQFDSARPAPPQYDAIGGQMVPSGSAEALAAQSPVSGNGFFDNSRIGVGKFYTDAMLGARQMYAQAADAISPQQQNLSGLISGQSPSRYAPLQQEAVDKRAMDAPVQGTWGGKFGEFAGALPLAFVPGANTWAGAGAVGAATGALQPTVAGESRAVNSAAGAAVGAGANIAGNAFSKWLTNRAAQPFMGWNQKTANAAAADAVGSGAKALDQPAIADTSDRLGQVFQQARSPNVSVQIPQQTSQVISGAEGALNQSSKAAFWGDPQINDLMTHLQNGTANAQELGTISSRLGNEAASQMASKAGDRSLGKALFAVQEHVDDLVGQSITDPELKAAYDAARPQYRMFMAMAKRPTILNSSTGDVNMRNLGNYLQKADFSGFAKGENTSDIYNAARFGQATGLGSRPPPPILQPIKWAGFHAVNNPVVGAAAGAVSRLGAPVAPALPYGLQGLGYGLVPYLEQ